MIVCHLQMTDATLAMKLGMVGPLASAKARATFTSGADTIGVSACDQAFDPATYFFAWPLISDQTQDEQARGAPRRPT